MSSHTAACLLALSFLIGCREQSPDSLKAHGPMIGTEYETTVAFGSDSGTLSSPEAQRVVVQANNMFVEGRENVTQFASESNTSLVSYGSEGELAFYMPGEQFGECTTEPVWLVLPASPEDTVEYEIDVVASDDNHSCRATWRAVVVKSETAVTVGDRALPVVGFDAQLSVIAGDSLETAYNRRYRILYSDSIRYLVREEISEHVQVDTLVQLIGRTERRLDAIHEP